MRSAVCALTIAPVLCLLLFRHLKPCEDNFFVRFLKTGYLRNLERRLNHRFAKLVAFGFFFGFLTWLVTLACLPFLGREFMPALEEGLSVDSRHLPGSASRCSCKTPRWIALCSLCPIMLPSIPEVGTGWSCQLGCPFDSGVDPTGFLQRRILRPAQTARAIGPPRSPRRVGGRLFWLPLCDGAPSRN